MLMNRLVLQYAINMYTLSNNKKQVGAIFNTCYFPCFLSVHLFFKYHLLYNLWLRISTKNECNLIIRVCSRAFETTTCKRMSRLLQVAKLFSNYRAFHNYIEGWRTITSFISLFQYVSRYASKLKHTAFQNWFNHKF